MRYLILILIFFMISQFSFASGGNNNSNDFVVSGTIVDAATKKPIADVTIVAKSAITGSEQYFSTDNLGQYKIPTLSNGVYSIRFEKNHYQNVEKKNVSVNGEPLKFNIEMNSEKSFEEDHHSFLIKFDII